MCFESFWCVDLKNDFWKIKKIYFDGFWHEKHFKKKPQPHFQTGMNINDSFQCILNKIS
jgi:hypothetical protein